MRKYLFALLLIAQSAFSATPTISGASLSGGTLTITGANFGTKSTAAPMKWEDFSSRSIGDTTFNAGFDFKGGNDGGLDSRKAVIASGLGSGKAFRHRVPLFSDAGFASQYEAFHHAGYFLSSQVDELFISTRMRVVVSGGSNPPSGSFQVKAPRASLHIPGETDGQALYDAAMRCFSSFYPGSDLITITTHHGYYTPIEGGEHALHDTGLFPGAQEDFYGADLSAWVFVKIHLKLNTMSGATPNNDGVMEMWINGHKLVSSRTDLAIRNSTSQLFGSVQMNPGTTGINGTDFDVSQTENYIDNTQAHVEIANNATYSSATKFAVQPAATWSSGTITATFNQSDFANGSTAYVFVVNSNGEINSTGQSFTITSGGAGDATATATGSTLTLSSGSATASGTATASASGSTLSLSSGSATAVGDTPTETRIKNPPRNIIKDRIKERISKRKAKVIQLREVVSRQSMKKAA